MRDYSEIEENAYYELRSKPDDLLSVGDLMTVSGALFPICPSVHPMIWVYGQHTRTPILSPTNISTHPPISILSYVHLPDPNLTIRPPSHIHPLICPPTRPQSYYPPSAQSLYENILWENKQSFTALLTPTSHHMMHWYHPVHKYIYLLQISI